MGSCKEVQITKQYACTKVIVGLFYLDIEAALFLTKMDFLESRHVFHARKFDP